MIYFIAPILLLVSIGPFFVGVRQNKAWGLYSMKAIWVIVLGVSCYLTLQAWEGRSHAENWDMIGVIFVVWPVTAIVALLAAAELFLLRRRSDHHVRISRILAITIASLMVALSASALTIW